MNPKAICALLCPVIIAVGYTAWPRSNSKVTIVSADAKPTQQQAAPAPTPKVETADFLPAIESGSVKAECKGNGRENLRVNLTNKLTVTLKVTIPAGQIFENGRNQVVAIRSAEVEIPAGKSAEATLQTAATRSLNRVTDIPYRASYTTMPKIDLLLGYAQDHPELSARALQTAVLALAENLPVSAVSKFQPAGGALPTKFNTDAFRVETGEIIQALTILRDIGMRESDIAMTIDPQLKIEAMIEPLCRAAAMRYYGITPEAEWEYWRTELTNGEPSTRHYALYGIARFYPEVALEMLPKWAREKKTNHVYRLSAIQALADTQRAEALPILRQLVDELGSGTELGRAAAGAAQYLDSHLTKIDGKSTTVAFRSAANF